MLMYRSDTKFTGPMRQYLVVLHDKEWHMTNYPSPNGFMVFVRIFCKKNLNLGKIA